MSQRSAAARLGFVRSTKLDKKDDRIVLHTGKVIEQKKSSVTTTSRNDNPSGSTKTSCTKVRIESSSTVENSGGDTEFDVKPPGNREFTVRFLGSRSAGKTSLMKKIGTEMSVVDKQTNSSVGSVLDETITVAIEGEDPAIIRLLDIPESENSAAATVDGEDVQPIIVFGNVDLFLVVYSVVDFSSVIFARACLRQLKKSNSGLASFSSTPPSVILVANKIDLSASSTNAQSINFAVSRTEGLSIAKKNSCKFAEVSSTTGQNLPELLAGILRQLHIRQDLTANARAANRISRALTGGAFGRLFGLSNTGNCDDLFSS